MKKKYLLLTEDHKSGAFKKDDIIMVDESSVEAWMETGIVEESTKKAYDKLKADKENAIFEANKKAAALHYEKQQETAPNHTGQNVNEDVDEENEDDLGNDNATVNGSNDGGGNVLKYYTLTDQDLTDEPKLTDGFKIGNEIEINEHGTWMLCEDGKLILKEEIKE